MNLSLSQPKYISELIPIDDIKNKWKPGSRILITAQTGSGKSEFIKEALYKHCKDTNQRTLLLSNRILLREQIKEDLKEKENEIVTVINFQYLETRILSGGDLAQLFSQYDYIVYDEAHYVFSDSQFNRNTDLLIQPLKTTPQDKIFLFLTATPQAIYDYQSTFDFTYKLPVDYSYIKKVYFYTSEEVAESILQNVPLSKRAIYFSSSAKKALELSQRFMDSSFFCSKGNRLADFSNTNVLQQIAQNSKFQNHFLFTTKVLDNGINLKDISLSHILIDMIDPITFIQCLGRKRILDKNDTITLYIKSYHDGNLKFKLQRLEEKIDLVKERKQLGEEEFKNKYRKINFDDIIDNDFGINEAKYQNCKTQARLLRQMIGQQEYRNKQDVSSKKFSLNSYENYICNLINFNPEKVEDGNIKFEKVSVKTLLQSYIGKKMFKEDQERFKYLFFDKIFSPKNTNFRRRGQKSIRAIIQEDELLYNIVSIQERAGENRGKYYWHIFYTEEEKNEQTQ